MKPTVIPQRDRYVEKAEARKYRLIYWRYNETFANRLGMDAERYPDHLRRAKSRRESAWPG